jgi:hypothetical protein
MDTLASPIATVLAASGPIEGWMMLMMHHAGCSCQSRPNKPGLLELRHAWHSRSHCLNTVTHCVTLCSGAKMHRGTIYPYKQLPRALPSRVSLSRALICPMA